MVQDRIGVGYPTVRKGRIMNLKVVVRQGIKLLDECGPADWRDRIDLGKLDMRRPSSCILGQLYDDFYEGLDQLNIRIEADSHGFNASWSEEWYGPVMAQLTEEWKRQISDSVTGGSRVE